jgi:hypothetical protein
VSGKLHKPPSGGRKVNQLKPLTNPDEEEKMTKKDFELIAEVISKLDIREDVTECVATEFARYLAFTNDRFDRERFIQACLKS